MTNSALLVCAALFVVPELCSGKKRASAGGVARVADAAEDVSEGYAGAVDLGSAEDKEVVVLAKEVSVNSQATTASISERLPTKKKGGTLENEVAVTSSASMAPVSVRSSSKEAGRSSEDSTSHKRKTNYTPREDDKEISQGFGGAEDVPANDEELPAIVGQLPQSAEQLPGLADVEMVEEIEEYVLFFGVVVFFVLFGVFPALQQFRTNGKGGMESLLEVAIRFSIVQQAVAVLGLTHHLNGMMAMQQQQQQQKQSQGPCKQGQFAGSSRCPEQTFEKAVTYSSRLRDESHAPSLTHFHDESHQFEPAHCTGSSGIGSLLEEALADNSPEEHSIQHPTDPSWAPAGENLLDSLGLIDTEEPLL